MSASHRHIKSKLRSLNHDPVKPSIKGFTSTVKGFNERQQEAQDVSNPTAVGIRAVEPSTTGIQSGQPYSPRTQRPAKSTTEKGERFTGKQLKGAVADWLKSAYTVRDAFNESLKTLDAANDAENEAIADFCQQLCQTLLDQLIELVYRGQDLAEMVQAEQSTDNAGQPNEEGVVETNTGEVPREGGSAGALDAAALDAGVQAVRSHCMDVSATHVATVDAATRLMAEQAEWKKVALQRAIADGDEAEAHRIRFGLPHYPASGVFGEYFKTVSK